MFGGQTAEGILYYNTAATSAPSAPTATGYDYDSGVFTGLTSGWQYVPITTAMGGGTTISHKHWQVTFHVETSEASQTQIITFGTIEGVIPIGTTLQSDNFSSGSAGWQIVRNTGNAEFNNVTARGVLDASSITTGTLDCSGITVSNLNAGSITAGTLDAGNVTVTNLNASNISTGTLTATNVNFGVIMQVAQGSYSSSSTGFITLTATNNSQFNTFLVAIANVSITTGDPDVDPGGTNASTGSNSLTLTGTGVSLNVGAALTNSRSNKQESKTIKSGTLTKGATYTATGSITGQYNYSGTGNILILEVKL